jgi:large subunit ribosomal protein L15
VVFDHAGESKEGTMKLHELVPNVGSKKNRKRVGRGISAGQGKTAGRGTKGQGARSGEGGNLYRQGGNLPFYRRLPFMRGQGFTPRNQVSYNEVNLDQLSESFKADQDVTPETLANARLLRDPRNPIVILGRGEVNIALKVRAHRVSAGAKEKIEKAGGSVELIGQTRSERKILICLRRDNLPGAFYGDRKTFAESCLSRLLF